MPIDLDLEALEMLQDAGQAGAERWLDWAVLTSEMGDGHYRSALIGADTGTWNYSLTWSGVHRDGPPIQRKTKGGGNIGAPIPRGRYMIEFHATKMSQGNQPWWFVDFGRHPLERFPILVRFTSPVFRMRQSSNDRMIWSWAVEFKQARGFV